MSYWKMFDIWSLGNYVGGGPSADWKADNEKPQKSEDPLPSSEVNKTMPGAQAMTEESAVNDQQISDTESVQSSTEETKDEKLFIRTVRSIRKKFMNRKLIGNINIYRAWAFMTTCMQCQISEIDYQMQPRDSLDNPEDLEGLTGNFLRAITMTDNLLDSMERRAMKWENVDYHDQVTLSRGAQLKLTDPFFGLIGYTLSIELTATVTSLVDSRRRYLAKHVPLSKQISSFAGSFSKNNTNNTTKKKKEEIPVSATAKIAPAEQSVEKKNDTTVKEEAIEDTSSTTTAGNVTAAKKPSSMNAADYPAESHTKATSN